MAVACLPDMIGFEMSFVSLRVQGRSVGNESGQVGIIYHGRVNKLKVEGKVLRYLKKVIS